MISVLKDMILGFSECRHKESLPILNILSSLKMVEVRKPKRLVEFLLTSALMIRRMPDNIACDI